MMTRNLLLSCLFLSGICFSLSAQSNLFIDPNYTAEEMIMDFFDSPEITITNVTSTGEGVAMAFFDAGGTDLGLDAGIVFSTGSVAEAVGPNEMTGATTNLGYPGDADIDVMGSGLVSQDAVFIEFDFHLNEADTLDFNYVFGSEEYPEFVNTNFNDAFAFFVSGPGIAGPFSNGAKNFSLVPNTDEAVAINSVNADMNSQYYIDNDMGQHLEYDGFTISLPAPFIAMAGETYHAKIVVADRGDSAFDSGIFLSYNSLGQDSLLVPPTEFSIAQNTNTISITNESKYARTYSWDFGNGETSTDRHPAMVTYATPGTYIISLTTQNYCCSEVFTTTVVISEIPMTASLVTNNNPLACFGDSNAGIDLNISGGVGPYSYSWNPSISDVNNVAAGNYAYTVTDSQGAQLFGMITIESPEEISIEIQTTDDIDQQGNGTADATVSGGTGNYTYLWSNGNTTSVTGNLPAGSYTLAVTDGNGCTMETSVIVNSTITPVTVSISTINNPLACFGDNNASIIAAFDGGIPPYTFEWSPNGTDPNNLSAGTYGFTITDGAGNTASSEMIIVEPAEINLTLNSTLDSGLGTGTASATATGGTSPYTYLWSNGETTANIDNLEGGEYNVTLTDANGCTVESSVTVELQVATDEVNALGLKLFPNPVKDHLWIQLDASLSLNDLSVFDMLGKKVTAKYTVSMDRVEVMFNEDLSTGIYFLQVSLLDGKKGVKRFVVN